MVSNYELIEKLEKLPFFNSLLKNGIIPINWMDYKSIYDFYNEQYKRLHLTGLTKPKARASAVTITADEYGITERTVYLIIKKMK